MTSSPAPPISDVRGLVQNEAAEACRIIDRLESDGWLVTAETWPHALTEAPRVAVDIGRTDGPNLSATASCAVTALRSLAAQAAVVPGGGDR